MAEAAPIGSLGRFGNQALLVFGVLRVVVGVDALLAAGALLEKRVLVTLLQQVWVQGLNLNDLVAVGALRQQRAVLPEVQVHRLAVREGLVSHAAELTLLTRLTC